MGHLVPINNYDVLSGGLFVQAGKMILHAILNYCHGVPGLSAAVVIPDKWKEGCSSSSCMC